MPVIITCASCRSSYTIAYQMRGKKVRCNTCKQVLTVPEGEVAQTRPTSAVQLPPALAPATAEPAATTTPPSRPRPIDGDGLLVARKKGGDASFRNRLKADPKAWILGGAGALIGVIAVVVAVAAFSSKKKDTVADGPEVAATPEVQPAAPQQPATPVVPVVQNPTPPTVPADVPAVPSEVSEQKLR